MAPPLPGPSPITTLVTGLQSTSVLTGYTVVQGANKLAAQGAPPRIVIYPSQGSSEGQKNVRNSIRDLRQTMHAECWGRSDDDAWDLYVRLMQALDEYAASGGLYWYEGDVEWDTSPDTARQGTALTVTFAVQLSVDRVVGSTGQVDSIGLHSLETTLSAPMAAGDTAATVASTAGFAASGSIYVDREQMTYTGITATTFTGLTRAASGTTAAAHATGASVTQ